MRRPIRLLLAAVFVLPIVAFAASSGGAVVDPGTDCAHSSGSATFSPGLWKLQPAAQKELHEAAQTITTTGSTTGCVGGGVTSGTFRATIHIADPANCNSLLSDSDTAVPATTGSITVRWSATKSSTASITLKTVTGQPTQTDISGTVSSTSNTFKGLALTQRIAFTPETGGCSSKNLLHVTFKEVTALEIG